MLLGFRPRSGLCLDSGVGREAKKKGIKYPEATPAEAGAKMRINTLYKSTGDRRLQVQRSSRQ